MDWKERKEEEERGAWEKVEKKIVLLMVAQEANIANSKGFHNEKERKKRKEKNQNNIDNDKVFLPHSYILPAIKFTTSILLKHNELEYSKNYIWSG